MEKTNENSPVCLFVTCVCVCVCTSTHTQSCLTLCDSMDYRPPGLLRPWNLSSKSTGVGCHFLLQEIFQTQKSNPCSIILGAHKGLASPALADRFFTNWDTSEGPQKTMPSVYLPTVINNSKRQQADHYWWPSFVWSLSPLFSGKVSVNSKPNILDF